MDKEYVTVFFCKDGTTEEYWWSTEAEAINHANMFTDADDGDMYDKIEVQCRIENGCTGRYFEDTLHTLTPWKN